MAKDGWMFVIPFGILFLLSIFLWQHFSEAWPWILPAILFGLLTAFCAYFFRDPVRHIPQDSDLLVSPADGTILEVREAKDDFVGDAWDIVIFLNIFNVHVQRSPFTVEAKVGNISYHPGKFLAAYAPKASLENEQNWIEMEAGKRRVVVKQIAGLIARRIACWVKKDQRVQGGQHLGLIRFGSQVDLLIPKASQVLVKRGDVVKGGETPLAKLNS